MSKPYLTEEQKEMIAQALCSAATTPFFADPCTLEMARVALVKQISTLNEPLETLCSGQVPSAPEHAAFCASDGDAELCGCLVATNISDHLAIREANNADRMEALSRPLKKAD